jgi:malate synthase
VTALTVEGEQRPRFDEILTADALDFLAELTRRFGPRRLELLQARVDRYAAGNPGARLRFLDGTSAPTRSGRSLRRPPVWPTGAARSPAPPRAR